MLILITIAGACIGFQIPEIANSIGGCKAHVPILANLMMAFAGAVSFYWLAS